MPKQVKNPTVSVIIAAYNEEKYIESCLSSLISQTLTPYEIIIADDGSTDGTWEKISRFNFKGVENKLLKLKHQEQAKARNAGAKKATGEIFVFPDADYSFDKKFIEKLVLPIIQNKAIASYTKEEYIANTENIWSNCWNINSSLPFNRRLPDYQPNLGGNFRAIKKAYFLKAGGFSDTGYANDLTVLRKLNLPKGSVCAPGAICFHYNPASLKKVFQSARRISSKGGLELSLKNLIIFSFINSLRKGIINAIIYKKPQYIIFKIVFDAGIIFGFIEKFIL